MTNTHADNYDTGKKNQYYVNCTHDMHLETRVSYKEAHYMIDLPPNS